MFPLGKVGAGDVPRPLIFARSFSYGDEVPVRSAVNPQLQPGEEAIIVLQRGPAFDPDEDGNTNNDADDACFPGIKAANAAEAGWDAVLLVNRHQASGSQADDEAFFGSGGYPAGLQMVTQCTTHEAFHRMFNDAPEFGIPYDDVHGPALGTVGERVEGTSVFDGWGYAHLYRNEAGKITELDAYAVPEALDERLASGFGDLSIHEFATDPDRSARVLGLLRGRVPGVPLQCRTRSARNKSLPRRRWKQLLGREDFTHKKEPPDRPVRSRLRPVCLRLHRPEVGRWERPGRSGRLSH